MSLIPSLGLSTTKISGAAAAAIIAASIGIASMGILSYVRHMGPFEEWLVPYVPTAQYGGIFLYSNVIWAVTWVGLFFALRQKKDAGSLKRWILFFLISLGVGTGFAEASLNWSQLSTVMQLGSIGQGSVANTNGQTIANEVYIRILEGSSIQGNPSYEPATVVVSKDDMVTWVNADAVPHTVTSGTGIDDPESGRLFDSGSLGQGQKFSVSAAQLDTIGDYDYYCTVHPFMKGRITVQ